MGPVECEMALRQRQTTELMSKTWNSVPSVSLSGSKSEYNAFLQHQPGTLGEELLGFDPTHGMRIRIRSSMEHGVKIIHYEDHEPGECAQRLKNEQLDTAKKVAFVASQDDTLPGTRRPLRTRGRRGHMSFLNNIDEFRLELPSLRVKDEHAILRDVVPAW